MPHPDTSLGGAGKFFPETSWELVNYLRDPEKPEYQKALEILCQRYWKPVYAYVRASWAKSNEDAKDLTQAFFIFLTESPTLARFDKNQGSFRRYLKVVLKRFVGHQEQALHRLKRGGGARILSLDAETSPLGDSLSAATGADPEKIFEQEWLAQLLNIAIARVRERCGTGKQAVAFQVYEEFALRPEGERPPYTELMTRFGLTESQVKKYLFRIREKIRQEIRAELARTTTSERQLEEEWNELFGSRDEA